MSNHNELLASHRVLSMLESACEYSEQILDNVPSVFVVLNQEHKVIRANKAFCDLVGCTMEGALHLDFTSYFTSENRAILLHHFSHLRASANGDANARAKLEFGGISEDMPAKPFFWRIFKLERTSDAEGQIISIIGDDLSGLYQNELKLMSIFASIPLGLMVVNGQGTVTEVLSEYCHVLLNQRKLVGESLHAVLSKHNTDLRLQLSNSFNLLHDCVGKGTHMFSARESELSTISELKIEGQDQHDKWIKPRFQPIAKNNTVDRYMVILEDITSSYLAQRQIEKADLLGKQAQALYECAIRDPLSGLYTRLFMNDSVSRLIAAARRGNIRELAVVLFDLDNFKRVNDTYGHAVGDQVIKEFGSIIMQCTRDTDVAVRYGGEEFVLTVPCNDIQEQGGAVVAERIRKRLAETPIDIGNGQTLHVTTSCGVAYCHATDNLDSLIQRADKNLYVAKHKGKNQVCIEPTEGE
jgi:two-component system cell cycle response regulator